MLDIDILVIKLIHKHPNMISNKSLLVYPC